MGLFLGAAFGFPTVLFTPMLVVVLGYWVFVVVGAADTEMLDSVDADGDAAGLSAVLSKAGLGRIPVTVALTMLICVAWFVSMMGSILTSLVDTSSTPLLYALGAVVLLIALVAAWAVTSGVVMGFQRFLPKRRSDSKHELVGRTCVIRIGEAREDFGQAEITTAGGAAISIPVRTTSGEVLPLGSTALIFDHSPDDDVFLVTAFDAALDPGQ
ncbi:OB-fold-containig protein [Nocardiopsis ganjiahuensis]|uniref:OB-fold-containig protein n=1 Tax=Nocardiopsis ganjiahuensis TaxID=239984 RepID=UPI00034CCC0C|nr:OB-fold-containig protein [Nocardiopsis ganjiahuensis]